MDKGWVKSYRSKWRNPVFRSLLEAAMWSWLCETAVWKETKVRFNGELAVLQRGQLITSVRFMSKGFTIGEQVTRRFLENIENDGMINTQATHRGTIITICNYDKYQDLSDTDNEQEDNQPTISQQSANTNKKEIKKIKKERTISTKTSLTEDWVLPDEWGDWAVEQGMNEDRVVKTWPKFRDHHLGRGNKQVDWKATWRTWVRKSLENGWN